MRVFTVMNIEIMDCVYVISRILVDAYYNCGEAYCLYENGGSRFLQDFQLVCYLRFTCFSTKKIELNSSYSRSI